MKTRIRGALTSADVFGRSADELRRLVAAGYLLPISGAEEPDPDPDPDPDPERRTVPLSQFERERRRRADAERELAELEAQKKELEDREKSEVDRLKARNAELEAEVATLTAGRESDRRESLLSDAARDAGFHNPRAALSMLDRDTLDGIDSAETASAAVKALARREKWLVRSETPTRRDGVSKILKDGRRVDPSKPAGEESEPEPGLGTLRAAYAESGASSQD